MEINTYSIITKFNCSLNSLIVLIQHKLVNTIQLSFDKISNCKTQYIDIGEGKKIPLYFQVLLTGLRLKLTLAEEKLNLITYVWRFHRTEAQGQVRKLRLVQSERRGQGFEALKGRKAIHMEMENIYLIKECLLCCRDTGTQQTLVLRP